jgi:dye decolorizing peroxidase
MAALGGAALGGGAVLSGGFGRGDRSGPTGGPTGGGPTGGGPTAGDPSRGGDPSTADRTTASAAATAREPFHGVHQAGIETPPQARAAFVALDLLPGVDREALGRLLRLLTDDAARLTQGRPALADTTPELAELTAGLTVTFGFGPGLFRAAGVEHLRPASVAPLPAFAVDRLEPRWSGGDLLLQICADDDLALAHAVRVTLTDARAFARVRWVQRGFRRAHGMQAPEVTQRNIMGIIDGTANPAPGTGSFDASVWTREGPQWIHEGTTLVIRRIRANLDTWAAADQTAREFAIGRRLDTGAPLTGTHERDLPDLDRRDALGFPVISPHAHIRLARPADDRSKLLRRAYNFDDGISPDGTAEAGLIFASYQADIDRQFLPVQRRIAEADLLNLWVTPVGSAVFAIPPGCAPGGWIGETLLA